jgi:tagatose 6-phosphate kinase
MILCLGTTPALQRTMTFQRLKVDDVNRATGVRQTASGKSPNVARVLHTLQRPVLATGLLGGETGRLIRADLDAIGLRHDFVEVRPPTRMCITLLDRQASTATELIEESTRVDPDDYGALLARLESLLAEAAVLVLSGSLPPRAPGDFYQACTRCAARRGVKVILDAAGEPLVRALSARPFLVKPNRRELAASFNRAVETDAALHEAMRQVVAAGAQWVVVTMGAGGARVSDGRNFWRVRVPSIQVVNAIGSGDAFAAGLAAAIHDGQALPEACRLAAACASANALTDTAGFVQPADVADLQPQIQIDRIS